MEGLNFVQVCSESPLMQTKSRTQAFSPQCLSLAVLTQGGRPGKTESRGMMYLDVWRSGTFLLYSCKAAFGIQEMSLRLSDDKHSVVLASFPGSPPDEQYLNCCGGRAEGEPGNKATVVLQSVLRSVARTHLLFFQECATPPHVQVCHTM